jgi:hypothetical protein
MKASLQTNGSNDLKVALFVGFVTINTQQCTGCYMTDVLLNHKVSGVAGAALSATLKQSSIRP